MISILAAFGTALLATTLAPAVLTRGTWQVWRPRLAMALWHVALLGGAVALFVGVLRATQLLLDHTRAAFVAAGDAASAGAHAADAVASLALWGGLFVLGAVLALGSARMEPVLRTSRGQRDVVAAAMLTLAHERVPVGDLEVFVIRSTEPLAAAVRLPEPAILLSSGLLERLDADEVRAVIRHERTHLVQRHHLFTALAALNAACLPRFGPAAALRSATHLLLELIADDAAARSCGSAAAIRALRATAPGDPATAERADRLARLAQARRYRTRRRTTAQRA